MCKKTKRLIFVVSLLTLGATLIGSVSTVEAQPGGIHPKLPEADQNHLWYINNDSDTVIVFVHGLFSDSRSAWLASSGVFWPRLIAADERLGQPSIYLGGFFTALSSGEYGIRDAANELYRRLTLGAVFQKREILFVTHSTGGIVVRQLLVRKRGQLQDKKIGLMLIASPSTGSRDASRLSWLSDLAKNRMSIELRWDHPLLEDLDREFRDLVYQKGIPCLRGVEAIENHLVFSKWWGLVRDEVLVEMSSAGHYFGDPQRLPSTDHFTAVKPDDIEHPAHALLRFFYQTEFSRPCGQAKRGGNPGDGKLKVVVMDTNFERNVYDDSLLEQKLTNAHFIGELIKRDVGLERDVSTDIIVVGHNFRGDYQIVDKDPDLVVLHRSVFETEEESDEDSDGSNPRLQLFLSNMAGTRATFLIYSRGWRTDSTFASKIGHDTGLIDRVRAHQFRSGNPWADDQQILEFMHSVKDAVKDLREEQ